MAAICPLSAHVLVAQLVPAGAIVVADAYYSAQGFLRALLAANLHFIGRVRSTTVAYDDFAAHEE